MKKWTGQNNTINTYQQWGEETAKKQQLKNKKYLKTSQTMFFVCSSSGFWTVGCVVYDDTKKMVLTIRYLKQYQTKSKKKKTCCKTHQKKNNTMTINQKHVNNNWKTKHQEAANLQSFFGVMCCEKNFVFLCFGSFWISESCVVRCLAPRGQRKGNKSDLMSWVWTDWIESNKFIITLFLFYSMSLIYIFLFLFISL